VRNLFFGAIDATVFDMVDTASRPAAFGGGYWLRPAFHIAQNLEYASGFSNLLLILPALASGRNLNFRFKKSSVST
jgi:hypothetical protein